MKKITVIGTGYVGLVTGTCFADLGNRVVGLDIDEQKIALLREGRSPIYEPGLEEMVRRNLAAGRLSFTTSYEEALKEAEFVFVAVGTPEGVDGEADLRYVRMAAESIAQAMDHPLIIVNKSTVPVGTGDFVADIIRKYQKEPIPFWVVSNPEFLREGSALNDFLNPDRIVLGSTDPEAAEKVAQLYLPLRAPILVTNLRTAEMIKYASNAFLATRISFINEIAAICERLGADVREVAIGMGYDKRIGPYFLDAGIGYGGSCFDRNTTVFVRNGGRVTAKPFEALAAEGCEVRVQGGVEVFHVPDVTQVLSFDLTTGRRTLAEVLHVTRRWYEGPMVTLKARMGRELRVTADHPVVIYDREAQEPRVVPATQVRPGDHLMAVTQLPHTHPRGAWSGDGAVTRLQEGRNFMYEYGTASKLLAEGMAVLLPSLGVVPSIRQRRMNKSRQVAYLVRVSGIEQVERLRSIFGPQRQSEIERLIGDHERRITRSGFQREQEFVTLEITEVIVRPAAEHVYSMETTTGTLLTGSGLVAHNCFPKDVKALEHMALVHGAHPQLLRAVMEINRDQRRRVILKLRELLGGHLRDRVIGLLGLAFKPNTDDMREAPSIELYHMLVNEGAIVRGYDPVALENARRILQELQLAEDPYDLAAGADALVVVTEWNEFKHLDLVRIKSLMRGDVLIDGRNIYDPARMRELGFRYRGMGRGYEGDGS